MTQTRRSIHRRALEMLPIAFLKVKLPANLLQMHQQHRTFRDPSIAACLQTRTQVLLRHSWTSARTQYSYKLNQKVPRRAHGRCVLNQPRRHWSKRRWFWARAGQMPAVKPLFHCNVHGTWTTHRRCVCLHRSHPTSRRVQRRTGRREERDARRNEIKAAKRARTRKWRGDVPATNWPKLKPSRVEHSRSKRVDRLVSHGRRSSPQPTRSTVGAKPSSW
mmetsp:Transcript_4078/g.25627  ORF Transcript_4078/g.25627 Transcript_4078/m.25627 type:complete len:219 (-) Transcript_4078:3301-3957(-)